MLTIFLQIHQVYIFGPPMKNIQFCSLTRSSPDVLPEQPWGIRTDVYDLDISLPDRMEHGSCFRGTRIQMSVPWSTMCPVHRPHLRVVKLGPHPDTWNCIHDQQKQLCKRYRNVCQILLSVQSYFSS